MKAFNSTLNQVSKKRLASDKSVGLKARHGLKSKTHLKTASKKMKTQKRLETALKLEMLIEYGYKCQFCGNSVFTHRLDKHEIKPRGEGGDPLDKGNCIILCCFCHARVDLDSTKPEKITREMLYEIKCGRVVCQK